MQYDMAKILASAGVRGKVVSGEGSKNAGLARRFQYGSSAVTARSERHGGRQAFRQPADNAVMPIISALLIPNFYRCNGLG